MEKALEYAKNHREDFLKGLNEFIKIPTVSTQEKYKGDLRKGAEHLASKLSALGVKARIEETPGNPIVYGELLRDEKLPTLLIYGHYDVQPAEPLEDWVTPPFEPSVRDGKLYARGSTDDKGQVWIHLAVVEAFLKSGTELPVNLKFCIEGEEEIGSPNLIPFFQKNQELLKADGMLISDTPFIGENIPTITSGLRGLIYFEIEVQSVSQDLHSGSYGGSVDNPCHALARIISSLHDEKSRINIPGFYDEVLNLSETERADMAALPFNEEKYRTELKSKKLWGEEGYSVLEQVGVRPSLDVNGLWGGYTEKGAKTIIPAKASAKISMRLVPNQNPKEISKLFEEHLKKICPDTVSLKVTPLETGIYPYLADTNHPYFEAAQKAFQKAFQTDKVVYNRQGGSIPFVPVVAKTIGVPCILMGFGLPGEQAHSPNEWFDLNNFYRGIDTVIHFYGMMR